MKQDVNWYLLQTKPNSHLIASKHLKQQKLEVFLPLIQKTSKTAQKFVTKLVPLFPSYLFFGSSSQSLNWKSINSTRGVARVVTLDGTYHPIQKEIINGLRSRCNDKGVFDLGSNISEGDYIKIENGPLNDFICQVEHIDSKQRVWVIIEIMQQKIFVKVPLRNVSKSH